jgi:hypothetical protein
MRVATRRHKTRAARRRSVPVSYDVVQLPPPPRRRQKANTTKIGGGATLRRRGQTNHRGPARSNAVCNNARSSRAKSSPPRTFS